MRIQDIVHLNDLGHRFFRCFKCLQLDFSQWSQESNYIVGGQRLIFNTLKTELEAPS